MENQTIIYRPDTKAYVINNVCIPSPDDTTVPENIRNEFLLQYQEIHAYALEHPELVEEEPKYVAPEPTQEEIEKQYIAYIQKYLDKTAYSYGYTGPNESIVGSCNSVCTYFNTGVQKFDDEGDAFRKWRSAVWSKGYEVLALVKSGEIELPTKEEVIEMLPKLEVIYTTIEEAK